MLLWPYQDITHRVSRCICSIFVRPFSSLYSESNLQCEVGPRKSMLIFSNAHLKEVSWLHCYCCTQALEELWMIKCPYSGQGCLWVTMCTVNLYLRTDHCLLENSKYNVREDRVAVQRKSRKCFNGMELQWYIAWDGVYLILATVCVRENSNKLTRKNVKIVKQPRLNCHVQTEEIS